MKREGERINIDISFRWMDGWMNRYSPNRIKVVLFVFDFSSSSSYFFPSSYEIHLKHKSDNNPPEI